MKSSPDGKTFYLKPNSLYVFFKEMYLRSIWRIFIWILGLQGLITIQNPNHVMHIDGKEIGTNFQFLGHFILFNSFAPFTAPHKQAHRRYLRINNACAAASMYIQRK